MVQIVDVSIKCYLHDDIAGPYLEGMPDNIFWKIDIYGILAISDKGIVNRTHMLSTPEAR
jgi:hypothetical protein